MFARRHRPDRPLCGGAAAGEVPVRPGGVLPDPVPQPAHQVWEAPPQTSLTPHCLRLCDRTTFLRQTPGKSDHRDHHQRHAPDRKLQLQL